MAAAMVMRMVMRIVLLHLILACTTHSVAAQNASDGQNIDAPYQGAFHSDPSDLYALKQLWSAWNATPDVETNLAGWNALSEVPLKIPCVPDNPWRGVFCNAKSNSTLSDQTNLTGWDIEITGLALSNISLTGVIPDAIGNLTNLVTITVTNNRGLTGDLPIGMENLQSLFDMDLHGNSITGNIPDWGLNSFVFLQNINIADNKMTGGLPRDRTTSFRAVQTFNLSYNLFTGNFYLVDVFSYLHKVVSVDLSHNQFTGRMPFFVNYTVDGVNATVTGPLTYLDLSSNKFNESLPSITGHKTLQYFNVSNNLLQGSLDPKLLSNVPTLTEMDLSHNLFSGSLPNLFSLQNLQHLDLSYNNFEPSSFPTWTMGLMKLQSLVLRGVSLIGEVPSPNIGDFTNLETLALDNNYLHGTLDLDKFMFVVANRNRTLRLVTLTNNQIQKVTYSGRIVNLITKFDLTGNPYCDNSTSPRNDLSRCVCRQQCADTPSASSDKKVMIIASALSSSVLVVSIAICSVLLWRNKRERFKLILGAEQKFAEYEVKPTIFTYTEMIHVTRAFSMKLGQGAFGAVYKGTLANGVEVAVKQLYTKSQQSLDDFLNEIVLVAAVKHRNLVKLKGCCIRRNQRLLVYEFVENGDLEQFLFGKKSGKKNWDTYKNICYGVAEGIHYLHFATQPKIIHRDIKCCNILLDNNMEPKIADFGLAMLYPESESHIMTIHIAGTRGYLAPEYAHLGQLSEKVDVFSYGVLLLEIVSGRRNMNLKGEELFYLPDWAWNLHMEGKLKELIDPTLELQPREETEALRIMNIALLCVHQSGERRPDMKAVLAMLHGGMDAEVSRLLVDHESDRVRSHGSRATSLSNAVSATDESISLMSKVYQNLSAEMTSSSNANLSATNPSSEIWVDASTSVLR